jgi:hypothetical protein
MKDPLILYLMPLSRKGTVEHLVPAADFRTAPQALTNFKLTRIVTSKV